MAQKHFFTALYVALSVGCLIAASWFLGASFDAESRWAGGWIFGLAFLPIALFLSIEIANAQRLPKSIIGNIFTIFFPYFWILFPGISTHQSLAEMTISASLATCIAGCGIHAYLMSTRVKDSDAFFSFFIPQFAFYIPTMILAFFMAEFLWNVQGGSYVFVLSLIAAVAQRVVGMYPAIKKSFL